MSRVRIQELMAKRKAKGKGGKRLSMANLARAIFHDDDCSDGRKRNRIVNWGKGSEFSKLDPKHILRLARELKVTRIDQLFEDDGA